MTKVEDHLSQVQIIEALNTKRLIICCGAGGVGKTTTAAALALAGARLGKQVLALTIDPSKRLAQTLGVDRNTPEPVLLSRERLTKLKVPKEGAVHAWLLDPKLISDQVVNEEAGEEASTLKANLIYQQISSIVAGMQEYTAVEALHQFIKEDKYDLIILDTPPSRHTLRFIDSPDRVASFLDKRIFKLFVPSQGSLIGKVASKLIDEVLDRAFGEVTRKELKQFFELFSRLLDHLNQNQTEMAKVFRSHDVLFYLITTAREDAVDEAQRFALEVEKRALMLGGFLVNRCPRYLNETIDVDIISQRFNELLSRKRRSQDEQEAMMTLQKLFQEPMKTTIHTENLRLNTIDKLSKLGPVSLLQELNIDGSTLEGISELAQQILQPLDH